MASSCLGAELAGILNDRADGGREVFIRTVKPTVHGICTQRLFKTNPLESNPQEGQGWHRTACCAETGGTMVDAPPVWVRLLGLGHVRVTFRRKGCDVGRLGCRLWVGGRLWCWGEERCHRPLNSRGRWWAPRMGLWPRRARSSGRFLGV